MVVSMSIVQKEERAHDDRIEEANSKIKQAGINFERKSKKSPQAAVEEHTRYMNLLSTLGSEVNRDKERVDYTRCFGT